MRTDGQTNRDDEANSRFSQFLRVGLKIVNWLRIQKTWTVFPPEESVQWIIRLYKNQHIPAHSHTPEEDGMSHCA